MLVFLALSDTEWMSLYDRMGEWLIMLIDAMNMVGSQQQDEDKANNLPHEQ